MIPPGELSWYLRLFDGWDESPWHAYSW